MRWFPSSMFMRGENCSNTEEFRSILFFQHGCVSNSGNRKRPTQWLLPPFSARLHFPSSPACRQYEVSCPREPHSAERCRDCVNGWGLCFSDSYPKLHVVVTAARSRARCCVRVLLGGVCGNRFACADEEIRRSGWVWKPPVDEGAVYLRQFR